MFIMSYYFYGTFSQPESHPLVPALVGGELRLGILVDMRGLRGAQTRSL